MSFTRKLFVAAASATLALTACAPSNSGSASTADKDVTVGISGSVSTLNPAKEAGILNYYLATATSEGLLGVDSSGKLVPALATSWKVDGSTYVFDIRQDAKFQDGKAMTIDDVLYSIDVAKDATKSPSTAAYWPADVKVEKTGDWQITITLPAPSQSFLWTVTADGGLWVTEKAYYDKAKNYGSASELPIGTGAFQPTEFVADSHVTLSAVDTWWGGEPKVDKITVEFFKDDNTRLLAQQSGDIDIAINVDATQLSKWKAIANTKAETTTDRSYVGLMIDSNVAPFNDPHVRKAIAYSVDKDSIVESILAGQGEAATSIESPQQLGSATSEAAAKELIAGIDDYEFDLAKAKEELAQSSQPNGFSTTLTYPTSIPQMGKAALALAENLKSIGITLEVKAEPVETWIAELGTGAYGLQYMSYTPTTGDPGEISGWLLGESNPANYKNESVQKAIADATAEADAAKRAQLIVDATKTSIEDAVEIPIWWGKTTTILSDSIETGTFTSYFFMTPWAAALSVK